MAAVAVPLSAMGRKLSEAESMEWPVLEIMPMSEIRAQELRYFSYTTSLVLGSQ